MTTSQAVAVALLGVATALNVAAFFSWRRSRKAWEEVADLNRRADRLNAESRRLMEES